MAVMALLEPRRIATEQKPHSHAFFLVHRHGFLALQGLEVPLMVLQSKVFLLVLLQKYSPSLSKRKTLIRRVKTAMQESFSHMKPSSKRKSSDDGNASQSGGDDEDEGYVEARLGSQGGVEIGITHSREISQTEAMALFTKIPFPEPRRVIHIKPRCMEY